MIDTPPPDAPPIGGAFPDGAFPDGALPDGAFPDGALPDGARETVRAARRADAELLGPLHLAVWLETYPNAEAGIDAAWVREQRGEDGSAAGIDRWREFIGRTEADPAQWFCRIVSSPAGDGARPLGFVCGRRGAAEVVLGPMYLLAEAQGRGLGGRLMAEFLAWSGADPIGLWVTEYNAGALGFYRRHGFRPTGERELWRGRLPNLRMARPGAAG
ncbi:GNAT family N-acetyltransferase [Kitasatospora sp. NPDC088134]|uniref:GNAT family N-acetyltransferase n=1 Tax=Kitasatospora sp. NPDC088134 TaxID=3364071 RepID=UPI00381C8673